MAFIKFNNSETLVQASVIPVTNTIVRIETGTDPNLSGFVLYLDEEMNYPMSNDEYMGYTTLYNKYPGAYELSNDGSVWEEDPVPEPYIPTVTFIVNNGVIDGEEKQTVSNFEDLVIPTVITENGYEFKGWEPEIPLEGEIKWDTTFYAVVEDKHVYFHTSGGGTIEGETKQFVEDYNELVVPTPVANDNYDFVGWMPEIPEEGTVECTDFYAVFESNIPSRLESVETDITDTQLGLVENYDFALTTYEEVTDLQLALVEVYDLILGGM